MSLFNVAVRVKKQCSSADGMGQSSATVTDVTTTVSDVTGCWFGLR